MVEVLDAGLAEYAMIHLVCFVVLAIYAVFLTIFLVLLVINAAKVSDSWVQRDGQEVAYVGD